MALLWFKMAFQGMWFKMRIKPFICVQNGLTKHMIQNGISRHVSSSKCELNHSFVFKMALKSMWFKMAFRGMWFKMRCSICLQETPNVKIPVIDNPLSRDLQSTWLPDQNSVIIVTSTRSKTVLRNALTDLIIQLCCAGMASYDAVRWKLSWGRSSGHWKETVFNRDEVLTMPY
jgi:hypothetical protein